MTSTSSSPIVIGLSDAVRPAFETNGVIGIKVINRPIFMERLTEALRVCLEREQQPGKLYLVLSNIEPRVVSSGIGRRRPELTARDFHVRLVDGQPRVFLKRGYAIPADTVTCVVCTRAAWIALGTINGLMADGELDRVIADQDTTHYLIEIADYYTRAQKPFMPEEIVGILIKDSGAQSDLYQTFGGELYSVYEAAKKTAKFMESFWLVADIEE